MSTNARLNEMYEVGRLSASDYKAKSADIDEQRANVSAKRPEPVLARQRRMLATLVDDWDEMTLEERRRVISVVFAEIHADANGIARLLPREDWKADMQAVLRKPAALERWGTERKTGLGRAIRAVPALRVRRGGLDLLRLAA